MADPLSESTALTAELRNELALFERIKPYLGRCLTLNHNLNNPLAGIIG